MKLSNPYQGVSQLSHEAKVQDFTGTKILLWNKPIADQLGLADDQQTKVQLATGQAHPQAYALAYAGHQFGNYVPLLGDGRAHLLGAVTDTHAKQWDIQLKGSGATQFSRGGDGLCGIGPAVREFIMSEALAGLKVPTTRCLSVALSGDTVMRQKPSAGAIVSRVASSHIRVGSFQFLAAQQDTQALRQLVDLAIERHYPHLGQLQGDEQLMAFFTAVMEKQIDLVVNWMRVGFIHGVMNTDNTLISGETIDYGPCAMMNQFDFDRAFSSIDRHGRYAYGNQPHIASWNLARFAETLIDLFKVEQEHAVAQLSAQLNLFGEHFNAKLKAMWMMKLGLVESDKQVDELISELLTAMQEQQLDFTNTFVELTGYCQRQKGALVEVQAPLVEWLVKWQAAVDLHLEDSAKMMSKANPLVIPRNHRVEAIIDDYEQQGYSDKLAPLLQALRDPYQLQSEHHYLQQPPASNDDDYQTFCGT